MMRSSLEYFLLYNLWWAQGFHYTQLAFWEKHIIFQDWSFQILVYFLKQLGEVIAAIDIDLRMINNLESDFWFIVTILNFLSLRLFISPIDANRTYSIKACTNIIIMMIIFSFYFDSIRMANEFQIDQHCEFFLVVNDSFHFDPEISISFIQVLFGSLLSCNIWCQGH